MKSFPYHDDYEEHFLQQVEDSINLFHKSLKHMNLNHILFELEDAYSSAKSIKKKIDTLYREKKKSYDDDEIFSEKEIFIANDMGEFLDSSWEYPSKKESRETSLSRELFASLDFEETKIYALLTQGATLSQGKMSFIQDICNTIPLNDTKVLSIDLDFLKNYMQSPKDIIQIYDILLYSYPNFSNHSIINLIQATLEEANLESVEEISHFFIHDAKFANKKHREDIFCLLIKNNPLCFTSLPPDIQGSTYIANIVLSKNIIDYFKHRMVEHKEVSSMIDDDNYFKNNLSNYALVDMHINGFLRNFFTKFIGDSKITPDFISNVSDNNKAVAQFLSNYLPESHIIYQPKKQAKLIELLSSHSCFAKKTPLKFWETYDNCFQVLSKTLTKNTEIFYEIPEAIKRDSLVMLKLDFDLLSKKGQRNTFFVDSSKYRKIPHETALECFHFLHSEFKRLVEVLDGMNYPEQQNFYAQYPLPNFLNSLSLIMKNISSEYISNPENKDFRDTLTNFYHDFLSICERKIPDTKNKPFVPEYGLSLFTALAYFPKDELLSISETTISPMDILIAANNSELDDKSVDDIADSLKQIIFNKVNGPNIDRATLALYSAIKPHWMLRKLNIDVPLVDAVDLCSLLPASLIQDISTNPEAQIFYSLPIKEINGKNNALEILATEILQHQLLIDSKPSCTPVKKVKF